MIRSIAVDAAGTATVLCPEEAMRLMGITAQGSAAYDLLTDDGVPAEQAARYVVACQKSGREPEGWARHFIELRRALRP